ncbi:MAG: HD domain-containing protein [Bacteroidota bacterium]
MNYQAAKDFVLDKLHNELSEKLSYHGLHHTLDVLAVAQDLGQQVGLSAKEMLLLKTAALYHDAGFTISNLNHEELGCGIVRENLPRFGYTAEDIALICGMIMATKIPQSPKNQLEEILCDADLDYLGRDDFYSIGATLYTELHAHDVVKTEEDWNRIQVGFLERHAYFTAINQKRRTARKMQYLTELKDLVATY